MDELLKDLEDYEEYDIVSAKFNGYKGRIYKDNMFGMEFVNVSVYNEKGQEVFHGTMDPDKEYTEDDVIQYIQDSIKIKKLLEEDR